MTGPTARIDFRERVVIPLALSAVTVFLFLPTIGFEYVQYDDPHYAYGIAELEQGINARTLRWALTNTIGTYWHPVASLFQLFAANVVGLDPGPQHLVSALLHAVTAGALYYVLRLSGLAVGLAFAGAALWAWHPMRVEDVAWVTARPDILLALLCVLTLGAYTAYARRPCAWRYAAVALCFALAMLTKPAVPALPVGLFLFDLWPLGRMGRTWGESRWRGVARLAWEKVPLLLLGGVVAVVAMRPTAGVVSNLRPTLGPIERILAIAAGCAWSVLKTFVPTDLAVLYPWSGAWPRGASILALILLLAATACVLWSRRLPLITAWGWSAVMLMPVLAASGQRASWVADRYTSIPHMVFFVGLLAAFSTRQERGEPVHDAPRLVLRFASGAAVIFALLSLLQVQHWRNSESLFTHALAVTRDNPIVHYNFGVALQEQGRTREAIEQYTAALRVKPDYLDARVNLGAALEVLGDRAGAERQYRNALRLAPDDPDARANLDALRAGGSTLPATTRSARP
ncbi:MAG: tetratricopeptide repeat protein [Tepidisphaeraceae bacterium]